MIFYKLWAIYAMLGLINNIMGIWLVSYLEDQMAYRIEDIHHPVYLYINSHYIVFTIDSFHVFKIF